MANLRAGQKQERKPGTFKPGQSGNPGGRKPVPPDIKEAFRALTPKAVEVLGNILLSGRPQEQLKASEIILDRAYGKATQPIAGDPNMGPVQTQDLTGIPLHKLEEIRNILKEP